MWKYLTLAYHRLTSSTTGEYLAKAMKAVEREYQIAKNEVHNVWEYEGGAVEHLMKRASEVYRSDVAALETLAEWELTRIEHEVEVLRDRAQALLDAGVAVGDRTIDALCLHAHLSNAVEKATPSVKV